MPFRFGNALAHNSPGDELTPKRHVCPTELSSVCVSSAPRMPVPAICGSPGGRSSAQGSSGAFRSACWSSRGEFFRRVQFVDSGVRLSQPERFDAACALLTGM